VIHHGCERLRVGRSNTVLDCPQVPVVYNSAGKQDANAAGDHAQHGAPPSPTVDGLHGCIEAHGPAPEQRRSFCGCAAVQRLLYLALAAEAADRQDGPGVHGKQQY